MEHAHKSPPLPPSGCRFPATLSLLLIMVLTLLSGAGCGRFLSRSVPDDPLCWEWRGDTQPPSLDWLEAEAALRDRVEAEPGSIEARENLAEHLIGVGAWVEASHHLLLKMDLLERQGVPEDGEAGGPPKAVDRLREDLAALLVEGAGERWESGSPDDALIILQRMEEHGLLPGGVDEKHQEFVIDLRLDIAQRLALEGRIDDAVVELRTMAANLPPEAVPEQVHLDLGRLLLTLGAVREAEEHFILYRQARQGQGADRVAVVSAADETTALMVRLFIMVGEMERALHYQRQLCLGAVDPEVGGGGAEEEAVGLDGAPSDCLLLLARLSGQQGDQRRTERFFQAYARSLGEDPRDLTMAGREAIALEFPELGRSLLQEASRRSPGDQEILEVLVREAGERKDKDGIRRLLQNYLAHEERSGGDRGRSLFFAAAQFQGAGMLEDSARYYREAARVNPERVLVHLRLGRVYHAMGELERMEEAHGEYIARTSGRGAAQQDVARELRHLGERTRALRYLEEAVESTPSDRHLLWELADLRGEAGDHKGEEQALLQAFRLQKEGQSALQALVEHYLRKEGDPQRALQLFRQHLESADRGEGNQHLHVELLLLNGEEGGAEELLDDLIRAAPSTGDGVMQVTRLKARLGQCGFAHHLATPAGAEEREALSFEPGGLSLLVQEHGRCLGDTVDLHEMLDSILAGYRERSLDIGGGDAAVDVLESLAVAAWEKELHPLVPEALREIERHRPLTGEEQYRLGASLLKSGEGARDPDATREALTMYLQSQGHLPEQHLRLGRLHHEHGCPQVAKRHYLQALSAEGAAGMEALERLGSLFHGEGAVEEYAQEVALHFLNPPSRRDGRLGREALTRRVELARFHQRMGHPERARQLWREVLRYHSGNHPAAHYLATAAWEAAGGDLERGWEALEGWVREYGNRPEHWAVAAEILLSRGEHEQALVAVERGMERPVPAAHQDLNVRRLELLLNTERIDEVVDLVDSLVHHGRHGRTLLPVRYPIMAGLLQQAGLRAEAQQLLEAGLEKYPGEPLLSGGLIALHIQSGDPRQALAVARRVAQEAPDAVPLPIGLLPGMDRDAEEWIHGHLESLLRDEAISSPRRGQSSQAFLLLLSRGIERGSLLGEDLVEMVDNLLEQTPASRQVEQGQMAARVLGGLGMWQEAHQHAIKSLRGALAEGRRGDDGGGGDGADNHGGVPMGLLGDYALYATEAGEEMEVVQKVLHLLEEGASDRNEMTIQMADLLLQEIWPWLSGEGREALAEGLDRVGKRRESAELLGALLTVHGEGRRGEDGGQEGLTRLLGWARRPALPREVGNRVELAALLLSRMDRYLDAAFILHNGVPPRVVLDGRVVGVVARSLISAGHRQEGLDLLNHFPTLDGDLVDALKAMDFNRLGQYETAFRVLRSLVVRVDDGEEALAAHELLVSVGAATDRQDEVARLSEDLVRRLAVGKSTPRRAALHVQLARHYAGALQFVQAVEHVERALHLAPDNPDYHGLRIRLMLRQSHPSAAGQDGQLEKDLHGAVQQYLHSRTRWEDAAADVVEWYGEVLRPDLAVGLLRRAVQRSPSNHDLVLNLLEAGVLAGEDQGYLEEVIQGLLHGVSGRERVLLMEAAAERLSAGGEVESALALLLESLELLDQQGDGGAGTMLRERLLHEAGRNALRMGDISRAQRLLGQQLAVNRASAVQVAEAYLYMGGPLRYGVDLEFSSQAARLALQALEQGEATGVKGGGEESPAAVAIAAQAAVALGDGEEAASKASLLLEHQGAVEAGLLLRVADALLMLPQPDNPDAHRLAEVLLKEYVRRPPLPFSGPGDGNRRQLGRRVRGGRALRVASERGSEALAFQSLAQSGRLHHGPEGSVNAGLLRAELRERAGDKDGAVEEYRRLLSQDPHSPVLKNNLAYLLALRGRAEDQPEALRLASEALAAAPEGARYYLDTKGWVLYRLGRLQEARLYLAQAVSLLESYTGSQASESLYHLGVVEEELGMVDRAVHNLGLAARLDPFGRYGRKAADRLVRLEAVGAPPTATTP